MQRRAFIKYVGSGALTLAMPMLSNADSRKNGGGIDPKADQARWYPGTPEPTGELSCLAGVWAAPPRQSIFASGGEAAWR